MVTRRTLMKTGGAAAIVSMAGLGGLAACAHGPGLAKAREPWSQAGTSFGDERLDALAYAILAPNPHNRQPWAFELVGDDRIDVYCDLDRRLPHTDPFDRQITIGFGCMLELMRQAGAEKGYRVDIHPFPDGTPQPRLNGNRMAQITFVADAALPDPLFTNTLARRSNKESFDTRKTVSEATLSNVLAATVTDLSSGGTVDAARTKRITDLAWLGWMIEYETPATRRESIDLMRIGNRAINRAPDGIDMGGIDMGVMKMLGIVTPDALDAPDSTAYKTGIDMYRDIIHTAGGFVWLTTNDNTRESQLKAGTDWVRLNLAANAAGLDIHPLSQVLQEFPEMREPYTQMKAELGIGEAGAVHMLGRIGYGPKTKPSPRWPLSSRLISA